MTRRTRASFGRWYYTSSNSTVFGNLSFLRAASPTTAKPGLADAGGPARLSTSKVLDATKPDARQAAESATHSRAATGSFQAGHQQLPPALGTGIEGPRLCAAS